MALKTSKMYTHTLPTETDFITEDTQEGETIEAKVRRIMNNKEPIKDGAPIIHTERKDGVQPQFDPRTDRFELAVEMTDTKTQMHLAKREERHKPPEIGGPEPIATTGAPAPETPKNP